MTRPARLVAMQAHQNRLTILFGTDDADVPVTVGLASTTAHALRHLYALHAHADGCHNSPPAQLHVDLLVRTLRTLDSRPVCVLVRPGPCPAFWLRVAGADGHRDLRLDLLDAACLLMSRRVAIELLPTPQADWDRALRRLVAEQDEPS